MSSRWIPTKRFVQHLRPQALPHPGRVDALARRVRWLDRYRRALAILGAIVFTPLLVAEVAASLGDGWSKLHATFTTVVFGVAGWCLLEVVLAWITAVWETECSVLSRDRGLPRAILYQRRLGRRSCS